MSAILKCSEGVQVRIPLENPTNIDRKPENYSSESSYVMTNSPK